MKKNKFLTFFIVFGVTLFIINFSISFFKGFQKGKNQSLLSNQNTAIASQMNSSLPMMVDKETRLDNVVSMPNNTLQYNYTLVNIVLDSMDVPVFTKSMKDMLLPQIKENPQVASLRDANTTLSYYYKDKNDKFITKIDITPEMYHSKY